LKEKNELKYEVKNLSNIRKQEQEQEQEYARRKDFPPHVLSVP
jgi:hypothetical protein